MAKGLMVIEELCTGCVGYVRWPALLCRQRNITPASLISKSSRSKNKGSVFLCLVVLLLNVRICPHQG